MHNSKLIRTLSTLSTKEFKQFEKDLINIFHKNEKQLLFIKFLSVHFPKLEKDKITKEKVFKYIYKDKKYTDIRIRELMSATFRSLKEFLVILETKSTDFYYELNLLKQFNNRKLDALYNAQLKTVKNILKKDKYNNKERFKRNYELADIEYTHFSKNNIRVLDKNIQVKLDNFDFYYFSTKLQETCDMLNRQKWLNQEYDLNLIDEIETLINKHKENYLKHATIICYFEIYKLLQTQDDVNQLNNCITVLKQNTNSFVDQEIKTMFDYPQNYCIAHINKGNEKYTEILFDLQKSLIDEKFILVDKFISQISYRNIVTLAIKLKEYKWAKKFNEDYKEKVSPEKRENSYNMNKANLFYSNKEYDKTIILLNQVEFADVYYAYYSKVILLKTYYAIKEFETLSYFITSFKLYLKRNKQLTPVFKVSANLFLSYFKKIFSIAEKIEFLDSIKTTNKLKKITKEIKNEKNIHNKVWLLEIIEDLT